MAQKLEEFQNLYLDTSKLCASINKEFAKGKFLLNQYRKALDNIDQMLLILPTKFPKKDERKQSYLSVKVIGNNGKPNTQFLYEKAASLTLEDWKFSLIYTLANDHPDLTVRKKYVPIMVSQGKKVLGFYPKNEDQRITDEWNRNVLTLACNAIAWVTYLHTDNPQELNQSLNFARRGYQFVNWNNRAYIRDTLVRILLKLDLSAEAFSIVNEAFKRDPNYSDFLDLKAESGYIKYLKEEKLKVKAQAEKEKQEQVELIKYIEARQVQVLDQFINPKNLLVLKYKKEINKIKQLMIKLEALKTNRPGGYDRLKGEIDQEKPKYNLKPWSEKEIIEFEQKNQIQLHEQHKVYLMEIGEGGHDYFAWGISISPKRKMTELKKMKKNFPITNEKIHTVKSYYFPKGWIFEDDFDELKNEGVFKKKETYKDLFNLGKSDYDDGCMLFGDSNGQNGLYIVMNGKFQGEIWSDTLQYGAEAGGCFCPATPKRYKLLDFIVGSMTAHLSHYSDNEVGDWL